MKALFIGGTGIISSACAPLAIERGIDLYLLNRGQSSRPVPAGAHVLQGDIRNPGAVEKLLGDMEFDVVVDWIAFTPDHIETDLSLFKDRTRQYIFISSASAYQTPPTHLPVTESTPLANPYWEYSQNKIACEMRLMEAYRESQFPVTIVRPSHTYDQTVIPFEGGYTVIDRMRKGKPVVVHGDGSSLWVLTHHRDFATGFVGLMGNSHAIGQAVHITSDELLTWNQIYEMFARACGGEFNPVYIPSTVIARSNPVWGAGLLGDKMHSMIFDNTKIKRLVPDFSAPTPLSRGVADIIAWYDADPARQVIDGVMNRQMDAMIESYE